MTRSETKCASKSNSYSNLLKKWRMSPRPKNKRPSIKNDSKRRLKTNSHSDYTNL